MENTAENKMGVMPIGKLVLNMSVPMMISMLVQALYNVVDSIFVSMVSEEALSAVSFSFPAQNLMIGLATGTAVGVNALMGRALGAGLRERADKVANNGVFLAVVGFVISALLGLTCSDLFFRSQTQVENIIQMGNDYLRIVTIGSLGMFCQIMYERLLQGTGRSILSMYTQGLGAIINIILDPIFIFPCGWGMMGAAIATVIGQILSAVLAAAYLLHMKAVRLQRSSFRLRGELLRAFLPLGMTSFLSQISIVFSMAAVLNMCRKYGALDPVFGQAQYAQIPTAVVGIVMKFFQIVISIAIGLSAGCIPVVGYNIGAGRRDRARALLHRLMLAEAVVGLVATALFESCPGVFADLFGAKNESAYYTDFAVRCIRWFLGAAALSCVNKGAMIYLQALGKAWTSTALSLLREIVLGVVLVLLLPVWFGLDGVLYFMVAADAVTFIVTVPVLVRTDRALRG